MTQETINAIKKKNKNKNRNFHRSELIKTKTEKRDKRIKKTRINFILNYRTTTTTSSRNKWIC